MNKVNRNSVWESNWFALIIFTTAAIIFISPIFHNFHYWGVKACDIGLLDLGIARETFLRYKQLPLWTPYKGGGEPVIAHPLSNCLSPLFLFPPSSSFHIGKIRGGSSV